MYSQTFDELIRQVTINCAERGLLLLRVRDEIRMTIAAYQTLYESSVAFGMRKALQAEQGKADMEQMIADLQAEKKTLEGQLAAMKAKCDEIERRETERRAVEERKHTEELQVSVTLRGVFAFRGVAGAPHQRPPCFRAPGTFCPIGDRQPCLVKIARVAHTTIMSRPVSVSLSIRHFCSCTRGPTSS